MHNFGFRENHYWNSVYILLNSESQLEISNSPGMVSVFQHDFRLTGRLSATMHLACTSLIYGTHSEVFCNSVESGK